MKVQKRRARAAPCKKCSRREKCRRDQEATIIARYLRAEKLAHQKTAAHKKQMSNVRTRAKRALRQERPYTPRTEDAKLQKIVADMNRSSIKKVDNATSTPEKREKQFARLLVEHYQSGH